MKHLVLALLIATTAFAQTDEQYTAEIRKQTTESRFLTELVDHLPPSEAVPSPLEFHGYIAGAEGKLTYAEDVYRYMRALETASPRVKVFSVGRTEEGREFIAVAIADEQTIAGLDRYRDITRKLSDPRKLSDEEARSLIASGKPIYYATGAMHSPETGSPEMLMELAYRLAVEETPFITAIRNNIITLITPVLEVDGRNRQVDLWRYREANPKLPTPPLVYWGKYVAHDNNRDQIGMTLALSQNAKKVYDDFHPQVMHDLHESVPFLYISTGTGPFNPALDPLMIDEWHRMGFHEMDELTRRGLPGVWLHGFWDGWAPNYLFWLGAGRNTIARFYETFGNRWPTTEKRVVRGASERAWFRQNPALPEVRWSLRNNINYQQSALLFALHDMAEQPERFLERYWTMGKRAVAKATSEGPAAWVIDAGQKRQGQVGELLTLLDRHGIEIHTADAAFSMTTNWPPPKTKEEKAPEAVKFARGSYVIRMDQPYSRLADTLLDVQFVRGEEKVYDDTGWTLGYLYNVDVKRVVNPEVLKVKMTPRTSGAAPAPPGGVAAAPSGGAPTASGTNRRPPRQSSVQAALAAAPQGASHHAEVSYFRKRFADAAVVKPRIALMHTWISTQDEGWWRLALESMGVPYDYISTQDVAAMSDLRARYDVVLFPPVGGQRATPQDIVNGYAPGPPLPWKKTSLTPNLGVDETDDLRPGLGLSGVQNLLRFVEEGGVLVTARDTSVWAVEYGLARWVRVVPTSKLKAPGTIVRGTVSDKNHPIAAGYDEVIPLYFSGGPVFRVGFGNEPPAQETRPSGRGGPNDPDVVQGRPFIATPERPKPEPFALPEDAPWGVEPYFPQEADRPKVVIAFAEKDLLLSGMLEGADEIAKRPAVIDVPRGKGHVILMSTNPMWRGNTSGLYALVMNAIEMARKE
jgi:hypothetical protein